MWQRGLPNGVRAGRRLPAWPLSRCTLTARLAALVFCLVALGGAAVTIATHLVAGNALTRQADQQLRSYADLLTRRPFTLFPGYRLAPGASGLGATGSALSIAVRASGGQLLISAGPGAPPSAGAGWLEISDPVSYQVHHIPFVYGGDDSAFSVGSGTGTGLAGRLVIGLNLAGVGRTVDGLTVICLRMTGLALLLATAAAAGVTRLLLRPAALATGADAAQRRAARDAAGPASAAVVETCSKMRRPLSVLAGLAEYHRGRGRLGDDADAERTMQKVAGETARMAELLGELEAAARDAPRPPRRRPKSTGR